MSRTIGLVLSLLVGFLIGSMELSGQQIDTIRGAAAPSGYRGSLSQLQPHYPMAGSFLQPNFYPSFEGYGGYFSPFFEVPSLPPAYPYLPNYWWVSMYPIADPRQEGYNPSSGYPWESVTALLLVTYPAKARITLDGIFVGTSDSLGPTQLPIGEHTLRVEASGYEPSETVLKIEQPTLQQLEIRLTPTRPSTKPGPRT